MSATSGRLRWAITQSAIPVGQRQMRGVANHDWPRCFGVMGRGVAHLVIFLAPPGVRPAEPGAG